MKKGSFLLLLLLTSCQPDRDQFDRRILRMEAAFAAAPDTQTASQLLATYFSYVGRFPEDHDKNSRYLYRAAALEFQQNHITSSLELTLRALADHYSAENTPQVVQFLVFLYESPLDQPEVAQIIQQLFRLAFPDDPDPWQTEAANPLSVRLDSLEQVIYRDSPPQADTYAAADVFLSSCRMYALVVPGGRQATEYLARGAKAAYHLALYSKSLELLEWIAISYPASSAAQESMLLRAKILGEHLNRQEDARKLYSEYRQQYGDKLLPPDIEEKLLVDSIPNQLRSNRRPLKLQ
ncbi:MAG: hypothetical protein H6555_10925 [Lewinellaceae bacterium]|nr:hypothetical protein [Lewinellaceae bacterium]